MILSFWRYGSCAHKEGNTIARPTNIMTVPENVFQNVCGISMSNVEDLRSKVNIITDIDSDPITTNDRPDIRRLSVSEDPMTIGKRGKIHGASTVSVPASTAIRKKIILLNF